MAKKAKVASTAGRRWHPRKRAEQQRSLETRTSILNAAIAEFAERGFEAASIRAIADRLGLQHPLITYHYRSKDILWRRQRSMLSRRYGPSGTFQRPKDLICRRWRGCAKSTRPFFGIPSRFLNSIGSCARKP